MNDDLKVDVRQFLSGLGDQMPMSEAEFRYRVEPLRAQREPTIRALLDLIGDEAPLRDLAVAALHELATPAEADLLADAFRDPRRSAGSRAEIGQVLSAIAADHLERLLSPEEIHHLSLLSIETLLSRMRDRAGLSQVVELYRGSSRRERRALLDAIGVATRLPRAQVRLGAALDPLFSHESDGALRELMIRRLAERREPASARALSRWLGHSHGVERRRVLEALRRFSRLGIRPPSPGLEAWMSGVDVTGSFNVGISFPAALELRDIVLACISVEAGLRAVNVINAASPDTVGEIGRALEEGQSIPVAPIDVPTALRHIEAARRQTIDLGRALPEGYTAASRYLRRPFAVSKPDPPSTSARRPVSRAQIAALLELPPYASWTLGEAEMLLPGSFGREEPLSPRRLSAAAGRALRALHGTAAAARLLAMLKHQGEIHRLRSETPLAARTLAAAREIEQRGVCDSAFARRLVERSLVTCLVRGRRTPRSDVRDLFKQRLEAGSALRRGAVAVLDLAEALYRQLENLSEREAPGDRLTFAQMEAVALSAADFCAKEFSRDAIEQPRLPGMEAPVTVPPAVVRGRVRSGGTRETLERRLEGAIATASGSSRERSAHLAGVLVHTARWFAEEVCLRRCRRGCFSEPEADGRELFFSRSHPAGLAPAPAGEAPSSGWASGPALRLHLSRRLDDRIAEAEDFLAALARLAVCTRGEARARQRRAEELIRRLRAVREEIERIEEDPAWLYAMVEETEHVVREQRALSRLLLGSALASCAPSAAQFAGFEATPPALAAWRRFERQARRSGLIGMPLRALQAAADRLDACADLFALLRGVAEPATPAALRRLRAALDEFWRHTPRSSLGARAPSQIESLTP
jgi:hypothetical protein